MISYSRRARVGYARLYRAYNDIDVFVEDSTYVGLYERLINRLLDGRARVTRVTPLGPRSIVEERAAADTSDTGRRKLYIVDGDLDLLAVSRHKKIPNLYRFKVYSIENLLLENSALQKYCNYVSPNMSANSCFDSVRFDQFVAEIEKSLVPYFIVLATARRLDLRGSAFSLNPPSVSVITGNNCVGPCPRKSRRRSIAIVREIVKRVGLIKYKSARNQVVKNFQRQRLTGLHVVAAKDFVMPYINYRIGSAGGQKLSQKMISSYLCEHVSLDYDPGFRRALKSVITA